MKKHLKAISVIFLVAFLLTGCGKTLAEKSVEIPVKPDYSLIPVYTLDGRNVYLNASITPMEFFSVNCPHCQEDLPAIQKIVSGLKTQKPLIYVATFFTTTDVNEAIKETKDFIAKYKVDGTVVVQAGPPLGYVKAVPSLVTLDSGKQTPNITEGMPPKEMLVNALAINTVASGEKKK